MASANTKFGMDLHRVTADLDRKEQFHRKGLERVREYRRNLFQRLLGLESSEKMHAEELEEASARRRELADQFRATFSRPRDGIQMERRSVNDDPSMIIQAARDAGKLSLLARRSQDQTILLRMASSRLDQDTRMALAENKEMRGEAWDALIRHTDTVDRIEMITRVDLPEVAEWKLSTDPSKEVRKALAMATANAGVLTHLATDSEPEVRQVASMNFATPPAALCQSLIDDDAMVRAAAFANPLTPVNERLLHLSLVDSTAKLQLIESRWPIPSSIESVLVTDDDPFVRKAFAAREDREKMRSIQNSAERLG